MKYKKKNNPIVKASILLILTGGVVFYFAAHYFSSPEDFTLPPDSPIIEAPVVDVPDSLFADEPDGQVMMERFNEYFERNNDLVGWIRVPNTVIDYPVVYCDDNDFYLHHDFNRRPTKDGTPFLDMSADLYTRNHSLSLYGHYLTSGRMFTALHNYKDLNYYRDYPLFQFDTLYEEGTFKIFSVFYMAGNSSDRLFYYYPFSYFSTDEAFMNHVNELTVRSIFNTTVGVEPGDQLVLLTCCTYEVDNLRLIIAGRRVRPGESLFVDTTNAVLNPAPLYPQKWYDARGGSPPDLS